jgi:DNA polymerase II large subunit
MKIANNAKAKGLDPKASVEEEIRVSRDLADRIEHLVGPSGVSQRIRELSRLSPSSLAFKVSEDIVFGRFGVLNPEKAAEQAIRTGTAILTDGVTAAPIHGITKVSIKSRVEAGRRSRYLAVYFAGPMRSAGGTEQALVVVLGDYVRRLLGLDVWRATDEEVGRFLEELRLYEREVGRFQYHVNDETIEYVLKHLPVEVTGVKTDPIEVSTFRDIPSIETNALRGGALRVVNDGIAGRASKVWKTVKELNLQGWDWLKEVVAGFSEESEAGYLHDIIAGRPVFSLPSGSYEGRFRLRYGRARNTGLTSVGVHPATMTILEGFIAIGTQLKLEFPGKGGIVCSVETVEPPIVRLKSGSVVRVESFEEALKVKGEVEKILFLGDLLVSYSEFYENDRPLTASGYCEEWWAWELEKALMENYGSLEEAAKDLGIKIERLRSFTVNPLKARPTSKEALTLSVKLKIPLHPRYTYFWRNLAVDEILSLRSFLSQAKIDYSGEFASLIVLPLVTEVKELLEKLLVPHLVGHGKILIGSEDAASLAYCLGIRSSTQKLKLEEGLTPLKLVKILSGFEIRDKYGCFIGARMGRPEKAKERKMKPPVHVLFPVGFQGGTQRNLVEASKSLVEVELARRVCPECSFKTFKPLCPNCGSRTRLQSVCPKCLKPVSGDLCESCRIGPQAYERQTIDLGELLEDASRKLGASIPQLVKGVKGLTNKAKIPEPLEKGILRAKYGLTVFKDGTIRFDATNAPLTHFKPSEIGVSVEKLKKLGYNFDKDGNPLTSSEQICELKVQDIVIPERCADFLLKVANFIDELLERFYGLKRFYNVKNREDLVGHLVIGLSPHTLSGVLGRIIGFSKLNVCYAHPLWISAKRRDCDGDEDSVMLALDVFLNFSKDYLPAQIGGIMDAPMLLTPIVNPLEVDDQVWSLDLSKRYPLEFYVRSLEGLPPKHVAPLIDMIMFRLGSAAQYEGYSYSHEVSNINLGVRENTYKKLKAMMDKLRSQMELMSRIEGVNAGEVAKRILGVHLMRDILGNLKVFASQSFRCKRCNAKFRRIPLGGRCLRCGGELVLTVYRGTVEKYLEAARWLAETYNIEDYHKQRIALVESEIESLFSAETVEEKRKHISLTEFM